MTLPDAISLDGNPVWHAAGTAQCYIDNIRAANPDVELQWHDGVMPMAGNVAALAAARLKAGERGVPAAEVSPVYLRTQVTQQRSS